MQNPYGWLLRSLLRGGELQLQLLSTRNLYYVTYLRPFEGLEKQCCDGWSDISFSDVLGSVVPKQEDISSYFFRCCNRP